MTTASAGIGKWQGTFANKGIIDTRVKAQPNERVNIMSMDRRHVIHTVKDGHHISVLPMKTYNPWYSVRFLGKNRKPALGLIPERYVAKPSQKDISTHLETATAITFASLGKKQNIVYIDREVPVLEFTSHTTLQQSILKGLAYAEGKNRDAAQKAFQAFFRNGYVNIPWTSETTPDEINRYGVAIGELLPGLLFLSGRASRHIHPMPRVRGRAKKFIIPQQSNFPLIDSLTEFEDGKLLPISSKFGIGAKGSLFTNLMAKGMKHYERFKPSVFRDLLAIADEIGVTEADLKVGKRAKDIIYNYGLREILKIPKGSGPKAIKDAMSVFTSIRKGDINDDVVKVLTQIRDFKNVEPAVLAKLPLSVTAFFSRYTAVLLNKDKTSIEQCLNILSGTYYWQANLNILKWRKGKVHIDLTASAKARIRFVGNKSAIEDVTANYGLIGYEMKQG